jgi:hypothetical protein
MLHLRVVLEHAQHEQQRRSVFARGQQAGYINITGGIHASGNRYAMNQSQLLRAKYGKAAINSPKIQTALKSTIVSDSHLRA